MPPSTDVLDAFFAVEAPECALLTGGMSDATVWRVGDAVLRCSPAGSTDADRLAWIAATIRRARRGGADFVSEPISNREGADAFRDERGDWWSATRWAPGSGLAAATATIEQQRRAAAALARFHSAVADAAAPAAPSRAIADRVVRLARLRPRNLDGCPRMPHDLDRLAAPLRDGAEQAAGALEGVNLPMQPVQVDSRPEHFLLTGDAVTGLIDFAAMRVDTPAVDVARLAGELAAHADGVYAEHLRRVVDWYNAATTRDVSAEIVEALDLSGAVASADNWKGWLADRPRLTEHAEVDRRLRGLSLRLRRLAESEM